MPNIETRNEIMKTLYNAILQADEDYANIAHLLLTKYREDYLEEEEQIMETPFMETSVIEVLPPEVEEIIKDPDVTNLVKQYKKTDEKYTIEKGLVDLDEIIEKPELEIVDKQEKLDNLKDISAKLIANEGGVQNLAVVKEIGEKVTELKMDLQEREDMESALMKNKKIKKRKPTKRRKRRRSY